MQYEYTVTKSTATSISRVSKKIAVPDVRGPLDIAREGMTRVAGRTMTAPWKRQVGFDNIIIAPSKEAGKKHHEEVIVAAADWLHVYTDGSKKGDAIGSGIAIFYKGTQLASIAAPSEEIEMDSIFHGELRGLTEGMDTARTLLDSMPEGADVKGVLVFTDSLSSVHALQQPIIWDSEHSLCTTAQAAIALKETLGTERQLELVWIPAHMDIAGNEAADKLAGQAAGTSARLIKEQRRTEYSTKTEATMTAWKRARARMPKGTTVQAIGAGYTPARGRELRSIKSKRGDKETRERVRWLGGYAFRRGKHQQTICGKCSTEWNTKRHSYESHLLLECDATLPARRHHQLIQGPEDTDDWLMQRPQLDAFLATLDPLRREEMARVKAASDAEKVDTNTRQEEQERQEIEQLEEAEEGEIPTIPSNAEGNEEEGAWIISDSEEEDNDDDVTFRR